MMKVGLTGEAGSGKSYVCDILYKDFGVPVIDSDSVTKGLMMPGQTVYRSVLQVFGTEYLDEQGFIDRAKLAALVFHNKERLCRLNALTHPATIEEIDRQIKRLKKEGCRLVVVESAIALDSGYEDFCDEFWYVHSPEKDRRNRLALGRGYSEEKIDGIFASQKKEAFFREYCTEIIENSQSTSREAIVSQLEEIIRRRHLR